MKEGSLALFDGPVSIERVSLLGPSGPIAWVSHAGRAVVELGRAVAWIATKTGLPSLIVVAAALVIALRLARKVGRIAVEFALAIVLLLALKKIGWVGW